MGKGSKLPYDIWLLGKAEAARRKRQRTAEGMAQAAENAAGDMQAIQEWRDRGDANGNINPFRGAYPSASIYTGHGGFFQTANKLGRLVGPRIRRALEDRIAGGIRGRGAYSNSLVTDGVSLNGVPQFASAGDETGTLCLTHREYITDIYGPANTGFNNQTYALNPGLSSSFPWLSQIAQNYEEYEFVQLMFYYRSTTTDIGASTNGQCGTVIMATNYNPSAGAFRDKPSMMEYDAAMSSKTTEHMMHGIECDPAKANLDNLFVRAMPIAVNQDLKLYDKGTFNIAICNSPSGFANQSIGELWVAYTVKLRKPKFYVARGLGSLRDLYVCSGPTTSQLLGTTANLLKAQQSNFNTQLDTGTANSLKVTFPANYAGLVRIIFLAEATGGNFTAFSLTPTLAGNVTAVSDMYGTSQTAGDSPTYFVVNAVSGNQMMYVYHYRLGVVTGGVNNTITFATTCTLSAGSVDQCMMDISQYNNFDMNYGSDSAVFVNNSTGIVTAP